MLDLYYILDAESMEDPPSTRRVASLTLEQHKALGKIWTSASASNISLRFFEDSRLSSTQAKELLRLIRAENQPDRMDEPGRVGLLRLLSGVQMAVDKGAGIVSISD